MPLQSNDSRTQGKHQTAGEDKMAAGKLASKQQHSSGRYQTAGVDKMAAEKLASERCAAKSVAAKQANGEAGPTRSSQEKLRSHGQKVKFCMYHLQGVCRYGADTCAFAHTTQEMREARGGKNKTARPGAQRNVPVKLPEEEGPKAASSEPMFIEMSCGGAQDTPRVQRLGPVTSEEDPQEVTGVDFARIADGGLEAHMQLEKVRELYFQLETLNAAVSRLSQTDALYAQTDASYAGSLGEHQRAVQDALLKQHRYLAGGGGYFAPPLSPFQMMDPLAPAMPMSVPLRGRNVDATKVGDMCDFGQLQQGIMHQAAMGGTYDLLSSRPSWC